MAKKQYTGPPHFQRTYALPRGPQSARPKQRPCQREKRSTNGGSMSSYRIHRTCPLLVLAASVVTGACGDPGPSPVMPSALVVSAGDHQAGPVGVPLPYPLQVALNGSDGRPLPGGACTQRVSS